MVLMTNEQGYYITDRRNTLRNPSCTLWPLKIVVVREARVSEYGLQVNLLHTPSVTQPVIERDQEGKMITTKALAVRRSVTMSSAKAENKVKVVLGKALLVTPGISE